MGSREPHYAAMTVEVVKLALVGSPEATPPRQPPPDEDVLPAPKLLGTILQVSRQYTSRLSGELFWWAASGKSEWESRRRWRNEPCG